MHITKNCRSVQASAILVSTAALFLITAPALLAGPLTFPDRGGVDRSGGNAEFAHRVERAADLIREQVLRVPTCRAYFARLGVDLDTWLKPNMPPHVVPKRLDIFSRRSVGPICGGTQGHPPFEFLFVDKRCFRGRDVCGLASLMLHEMGHLARRDTRDNEPPEFFVACRLSACVDPARYD